MKIVDIEAIELRVPGWTGATFDGSYDNCVIRVHTDAGLTGIAEVDSVPAVIKAIIDAPRSQTRTRAGRTFSTTMRRSTGMATIGSALATRWSVSRAESSMC